MPAPTGLRLQSAINGDPARTTVVKGAVALTLRSSDPGLSLATQCRPGLGYLECSIPALASKVRC
jgi:hypothetical protein